MGHKDVFATANSIVPTAHMAWPSDSVPSPPWAVYKLDSPAGMFADNSGYLSVNRWRVDLIETHRDLVLEKRLKDALQKKFGPVSVSENWFEKEKYVEVTFTFTEIGE